MHWVTLTHSTHDYLWQCCQRKSMRLLLEDKTRVQPKSCSTMIWTRMFSLTLSHPPQPRLQLSHPFDTISSGYTDSAWRVTWKHTCHQSATLLAASSQLGPPFSTTQCKWTYAGKSADEFQPGSSTVPTLLLLSLWYRHCRGLYLRWFTHSSYSPHTATGHSKENQSSGKLWSTQWTRRSTTDLLPLFNLSCNIVHACGIFIAFSSIFLFTTRVFTHSIARVFTQLLLLSHHCHCRVHH